MGYAICVARKMHSARELSDCFKHNMRVFDVKNADRSKYDLNYEPISSEGKTYQEQFDETIGDLQAMGALNGKVRKNAVRGIEVVLRYSREDEGKFDQSEWVDKNVEWLQDHFNPPERTISFRDIHTGEEKTREINNVKSVIVHNDEGTPHIHAFIVPVDDRGRLNAQYYMGNRSRLVEMQNSYAREMSAFGLERGEVMSAATAEEISRYYSYLEKATRAELPPAMPEETIDQYISRANEVYRVECAHHRDDNVKHNQEMIRERSKTSQIRVELRNVKDSVHSLASLCGREEIDSDVVRELTHVYQEEKEVKKAVEKYPNDPVTNDYLASRDALLQMIRDAEMEEQKGKDKERQTTIR